MSWHTLSVLYAFLLSIRPFPPLRALSCPLHIRKIPAGQIWTDRSEIPSCGSLDFVPILMQRAEHGRCLSTYNIISGTQRSPGETSNISSVRRYRVSRQLTSKDLYRANSAPSYASMDLCCGP